MPGGGWCGAGRRLVRRALSGSYQSACARIDTSIQGRISAPRAPVHRHIYSGSYAYVQRASASPSEPRTLIKRVLPPKELDLGI